MSAQVIAFPAAERTPLEEQFATEEERLAYLAGWADGYADHAERGPEMRMLAANDADLRVLRREHLSLVRP